MPRCSGSMPNGYAIGRISGTTTMIAENTSIRQPTDQHEAVQGEQEQQRRADVRLDPVGRERGHLLADRAAR